MMCKLPNTVVVTIEGDEVPLSELLQNEKHVVCGDIDTDNRDIYLKLSSRQALYDFARSLLQEAVYGVGGQKEFYQLISDGNALVVQGARLSEDGSRIFVMYEEGSCGWRG